jgi:4-oxalomesaconate tautomerase
MAQKKIPYMQLRGGSSKAVFFNSADLPKEISKRDEIIMATMEGVGKGDPRQIDGLGGADSLTSKVGIVGLSEREGVDLEFLFLQVVLGQGVITDGQNCGNILSAVVPFAIENEMIDTFHNWTNVMVYMQNSNSLCEVIVQTPNWEIIYKGDIKIDGVPGTGSPIFCNYLEIEGANCGALLPTGNAIDIINGIEVTCVDNGMPVVLLRSNDMGITGYETKKVLDDNEVLKEKLEKIRLAVGPMMNLGDVSKKTVPKMTLISSSKNGNLINTRTFIPHVCHTAIGVLGAVSVATGCLIDGSIADGISLPNENLSDPMIIDHPSGNLTVKFEVEKINSKIVFKKSGVIRTARPISKGVVYLPE